MDPMPDNDETSYRKNYNEYSDAVMRSGISAPLTYERFLFFFENSCGLTIDGFTETLIAEYTFQGVSCDEDAQVVSRSGDADYILKDPNGGTGISNPQSPFFDPGICPSSAFSRFPTYSAFDFSGIQEGDVILETDTLQFGMGHAAIVFDTHKHYQKPNGVISTFIQTIEAVLGGVQFGFWIQRESMNSEL